MTSNSSDVIPKEKLSAYQRWELASLHDAADGGYSRGSGDEATQRRAQHERETEAIRAQAQAEGYTAGYAAGMAHAAADKGRLEALLHTLGESVRGHEQHMVDEVLDLALVIARQLVGEGLSVRREFILPIVSAGLNQLPQSVQRMQLMLNPADMDLVRHFLSSEPASGRCQLIADPTIAPGGCRIETEQCEVDATIPSRWKRLLANLGRSDDWLEPA